jgi:hypothetical protein
VTGRAAGELGRASANTGDDFAELDVTNASFFVEKLGAECGDLQYLRELTMNGLQAIAALRGDAGGRVIWDLDWKRVEATQGRIRKLSMIDTGIGMTPDACASTSTTSPPPATPRVANGTSASEQRSPPAHATPTGSSTAPGTTVTERWSASDATQTAAGACNRRPGPTGAPTSGARSRNATSRGRCSGGNRARKSSCSATTSATTPRRPPRA